MNSEFTPENTRSNALFASDAALDAVSKCACLEGCPSCVRAGRAHFVETDKKYARVALEAMTAAWLRR